MAPVKKRPMKAKAKKMPRPSTAASTSNDQKTNVVIPSAAGEESSSSSPTLPPSFRIRLKSSSPAAAAANAAKKRAIKKSNAPKRKRPTTSSSSSTAKKSKPTPSPSKVPTISNLPQAGPHVTPSHQPTTFKRSKKLEISPRTPQQHQAATSKFTKITQKGVQSDKNVARVSEIYNQPFPDYEGGLSKTGIKTKRGIVNKTVVNNPVGQLGSNFFKKSLKMITRVQPANKFLKQVKDISKTFLVIVKRKLSYMSTIDNHMSVAAKKAVVVGYFQDYSILMENALKMRKSMTMTGDQISTLLKIHNEFQRKIMSLVLPNISKILMSMNRTVVRHKGEVMYKTKILKIKPSDVDKLEELSDHISSELVNVGRFNVVPKAAYTNSKTTYVFTAEPVIPYFIKEESAAKGLPPPQQLINNRKHLTGAGNFIVPNPVTKSSPKKKVGPLTRLR